MTGPGWTVCLTDGQLETEIEHVIAADHLPTENRDVYFLVTPDGLGSCTDHELLELRAGRQRQRLLRLSLRDPGGILYAVIPYNAVPGHCQSNNPRPNSSTADPAISTISHEHNEMVTDPGGDAWIDAQGNEDGDLCLTQLRPQPGRAGRHRVERDDPRRALLPPGGVEQRGLVVRAAGPARRALVRLGRRFPGRGHAHVLHRPRIRPRGAAWSRSRGSSETAGPASAGGCAHTFQIPGSYRVMLRSTDSWGNWAFASRTVHIKGAPDPPAASGASRHADAPGRAARRRRSAGGRSPGSGRTPSRGSAGSASRAASRPAAEARRAGSAAGTRSIQRKAAACEALKAA